MNAEDLRNQLKGYSPAAAQAQEDERQRAGDKKFAPPWYELKKFRAKLVAQGVYPNNNGIDGVVFNLENLDVQDGTEVPNIHIPLPKTAPGYPTDEINLMVTKAAELDPSIQHIADLDGLTVDAEIDFEPHPFFMEQDRDRKEILRDGKPFPKRCWYYHITAIHGKPQNGSAPVFPEPENVKTLAAWCVGKTQAEVTNAALMRQAIALKIQSDKGLSSMLTTGAEEFLAYAAGFGLVVGAEGKFELIPA